MNEHFSQDVHERNSSSQVLSFIVHERIRACFVHVRFVHERFLPISFLSFVFGRTNEKTRFFPFMFNVRSSLDERPFVRLGCGNFRFQLGRKSKKSKNLGSVGNFLEIRFRLS